MDISNANAPTAPVDEYGFIEFLGEQYAFDNCKASFFGDCVQLECTGPDIRFFFSKLRVFGAKDPSEYQDKCVSSERDDGDLGDFAEFSFFGKDYQLDEPWELTCVTANTIKCVMAFNWEFVVPYGGKRIPKRKRMRGVAKCSLTIHYVEIG